MKFYQIRAVCKKKGIFSRTRYLDSTIIFKDYQKVLEYSSKYQSRLLTGKYISDFKEIKRIEYVELLYNDD